VIAETPTTLRVQEGGISAPASLLDDFPGCVVHRPTVGLDLEVPDACQVA
jgi:hypothetical protein